MDFENLITVGLSPGLHETLALLTSQLHPDANPDQDLLFLQDVFSERSIAYLMKVWSPCCTQWWVSYLKKVISHSN